MAGGQKGKDATLAGVSKMTSYNLEEVEGPKLQGKQPGDERTERASEREPERPTGEGAGGTEGHLQGKAKRREGRT